MQQSNEFKEGFTGFKNLMINVKKMKDLEQNTIL